MAVRYSLQTQASDANFNYFDGLLQYPMLMRHYKFEAHPIGSNAYVESLESYETNLDFYKGNDFTFIPIPDEDMFYDICDGTLKEMSGHKTIDYDTTVREVVNALSEIPFLFFENYYQLGEGERSVQFSENRPSNHLIITPADLNKRAAKEMMFSVIADLENTFAKIIEERHPDSQSLFSNVRPRTIGRWKKAGLGDIQMHITEYMTLSEMQKVIAKDEGLYSQLGFDSRNKFDSHMSGIIDLRNRVMHANRTVIEKRDDVQQLKERLERVEELI